MELVVVLGMHRSGTSVVAGMLRRLGWDVGPEEQLMPAKPDNPRGFVEHLPAVRVNDRLLHRLGGSWKKPPAFIDGWQHDPGLDDLRDEAAAVIDGLQQRDADRRLVKDPRFSLTLPFWQTVVDVTDAVLVLRPPRPVIRSLLGREDALTVDHAATLYVRYLLTALRHDVDLHVVRTNTLFTNIAAELNRLCRDLDHTPTDGDLVAAQREVEDGLWGRSSRTADGPPLDHPTVVAAQQVHDLITGDDADDWRTTFAQLTTVEELAVAGSQLAAQRAELAADGQELRERLAGLRAELDKSRERAQRILAERERARADFERMREQRDRARSQIVSHEQEAT